MRRQLGWSLWVMAMGLLLAVATDAAEWGLINPGESTMDSVRSRYGAPTRTVMEKTDGYDTTQWVYEGGQAPAGMHRMVVDFGLLAKGGFQAKVVRSFRLEPKPGIFTRDSVVTGWGYPDRESPVDHQPRTLYYDDGLLVYFDKEGWQVQSMLFVLPQSPKDGAGGRRP